MKTRLQPKVVLGLTAGALLMGCLSAAAAPGADGNGAASTSGGSKTGVAKCRVFPADNYWNTPVVGLPRHPRSKAWMSHMSKSVDLHPDFGPAYGEQPLPYGIPITTVGANHATVKVKFGYARESDKVRYPLGGDTRIEGGGGRSGDRHAIIVDRSNCKLYETYATERRNGKWRAGSGAVWDLDNNKLRREGWTSADAAGLPILPGLLRLDEVKAGSVRHAIRFTTNITSRHHVWPARHDAGDRNSRNYPPMGARFRLRPGFSEGGYSHATKVVLHAMKRYGMVLADNGSPWYFQGESVKGWPNRLIEELKTIPARAFYAVDTSSMKIKANSGAASQ